MANGILGRIELMATLHTAARRNESTRLDDALKAETVRHEEAMESERLRSNDAVKHEGTRRDAALALELDNIVYNMLSRSKARGFKREDAYEWLHTLRFEQTYIDIHTADQKDFRVREYFDPLLEACDADKKLLLAAYKHQLDRYFPISRANREWAPRLVKVPFKPTRKGDVRTTTYTIVHNWSIVKKAA